MDCLFCSIVDKKIPAEIIFENDNVVAFKDINPQAPVHFLVIPKKHIATINDLKETDSELVGEMVMTAKNLMKDEGYDEKGFRLAFNCNADAGQTVFHIHLHALAGRYLSWPPG